MTERRLSHGETARAAVVGLLATLAAAFAQPASPQTGNPAADVRYIYADGGAHELMLRTDRIAITFVEGLTRS